MLSRNLLRLLLAALMLALLAPAALADSQVRAVRLSFVEGKVQIDRGDGTGFGAAYMNMPVTQGTRLQTGDDGRAEVQLEDGSAIRLTPNSSVDFPQLSLTDSGAKISSINLDGGMAYVDVKKNGKDSVSVTSRDISIAASHSRLRLQQDGSQTALAVMDGEAEVTAKSNPTVRVKKGETFKFKPSDSTQYFLAKQIDAAPSDDWNHEREQYLDQYTSNNGYQSSAPLSYGYSDLNYYGNFIDVGGYGSLWQPAFVGSGWSPFANGAWAFYPGLGYSWVSAYPWGWLPFHYGNWVFLPNYGWCWQPGFGNFFPVNTVVGGPAGFRPPLPPVHGHPGLVPVGEGPRTIFPNGRLEPGLQLNDRESAAGLHGGQNGMVRTPTEPSVRTRGLEPQRGIDMHNSSHSTHSAPRSTSPSVPHAFTSVPAPSFGSSFGGFQRSLSGSSGFHGGGRVH